MATAAAVGVANHDGWAHLVTVARSDEDDIFGVVVDRRRVQLVGEDLPNQPYHHEAADLPRAEAQALVEAVKRSAAAHAHAALATLQADLAPRFTAVALALRHTPFGTLPADVSAVLDDTPFSYVADTMIYLEALAEAGAGLGLRVQRNGKGREFELAATALRLEPEQVEAWLKELGRSLGPPWTAEHRAAAAAALAAMGGS